MLELNKTYCEDWVYGVKQLPDNYIDCVVTSPPYYGLRNYGIDGQLGMEKTPEEYLEKMVAGFREVRRVMKKTGTCWINMGDSYNSARNGGHAGGKNGISRPEIAQQRSGANVPGLKPKDLIGMPWMLAFALRADGWWLRQDIIWHKPNPMPGSMTDRCTTAHEYIFLLTKSAKYYFDAYAISTPYKEKTYTTFGIENKNSYGDGSGLIQSENWANDIKVRKPKVWKTPDGWDTGQGSHGSIHREGREKGKVRPHGIVRDRELDYNSKEKIIHPSNNRGQFDKESDLPEPEGRSNKRSVWTVATQSFKEAHFATFPEELIVDCIKAGCPENGIVLDPFMGAGTTGLVARKLNRNFLGFELNPKYIEIAEKRLKKELGLFI